MLNKIVTPPRMARPGSSNLALLSHIEVPADRIAPFESQRTISMDVQAWDVYEPESNRRVVGLMAHVEESIAVTNDILKGVSSITAIMRETNEHMKSQIQTNEKVNEVADTVRVKSEQILKATSEQKLGAEEIVSTISSINEITQVNAQSTQELASSTMRLSKIAETLKTRVDVFVTGNGGK